MKYYFNSIITGSFGKGHTYSDEHNIYSGGTKGSIVYTCPNNVSYTIVLSVYANNISHNVPMLHNIIPIIYKNNKAFVLYIPGGVTGDLQEGAIFTWINKFGVMKNFLVETHNVYYNNFESKPEEGFPHVNNIILNSGDKFGIISSTGAAGDNDDERLTIFFSYVEITK